MPPRARTPAPFLDNHQDVEPEPRSPQDLIHEIACLLQSRRDNVTFVQLALVRLSPFVSQYSTQLMAAGVVREAIIALARHHPENDLLVPICFKFLMTLLHNVASPTHADASSLVIQWGGVEATLDAMRRHFSDKAIQQVGYYLLCNYSTTRQGGLRLMRQGGFIEIAKAMTESSSDLAIQQAGCGAICHLVHYHVDACRDVMEDLNVVSLLVQNIKLYNTNQDAALLLLCACGALAMLADKRDCVKTEIVKMNGMPAILCILRHTSFRYGTQLPCSALVLISHLITARNDIKREFMDVQGVTEVMRFMMQHEKDVNVISAACVVFAALVLNSTADIVDTVLRNGVGHVIITAMTLHADKHSILFNACTVIGVCAQLCTNEMAAKIRLIPDCIELIVMSMKRFPENEQLQEVACASLGHLSTEKLGLEKELMLSDGLGAIVAATHQFPDNVVIWIALCSTVRNVAKLQDMASEIKSLGIVGAILVPMSQHQADRHLILKCLEALLAITNAGIDLDGVMDEASDISFLVSLRSSTDSKVAAKANAAFAWARSGIK